MHSSFKPLSADTIHRIREAIEATDRPPQIVAEQIAQAINASEASQHDIAKSGFVRVSGSDMVEFVERIRRDRQQVDASRRTLDSNKKKSALRADQPDELTPEYLNEQLSGWLQQQTATQNKGSSLILLSEVLNTVGHSVAALDTWVRAQRIDFSPTYPDIKKLVRAVRGDLESALKAA